MSNQCSGYLIIGTKIARLALVTTVTNSKDSSCYCFSNRDSTLAGRSICLYISRSIFVEEISQISLPSGSVSFISSSKSPLLISGSAKHLWSVYPIILWRGSNPSLKDNDIFLWSHNRVGRDIHNAPQIWYTDCKPGRCIPLKLYVVICVYSPVSPLFMPHKIEGEFKVSFAV